MPEILTKNELAKIELRAMTMSFDQVHGAHKRVMTSLMQLDVDTDEQLKLNAEHLRVGALLSQKLAGG